MNGQDLIREVETELDRETAIQNNVHKRARLKLLARELRAARAVVRAIERKMQEVANAEPDPFV